MSHLQNVLPIASTPNLTCPASGVDGPQRTLTLYVQ
jgi:hypothetical protein